MLGGLVMVAVYLYLDAPAPGCETITGTVTHVYSTFPRYSSNRVICRIRLPHDLYIEEHCRSPHVGTYVYVCKTYRRLSGIPGYRLQ